MIQSKRVTSKSTDLRCHPYYVGVPRLERGTPCSQSRCASQLRHTPFPKWDGKVKALL